MDEGTRTSSSPATEWAASASERDYARNRHELDALVIASVPDYEATIRRELDDFDAAVTAAHVRYKQKYGGPAKYARWLQHTLLWTSLLCVLFAYAFVFPTGGRSGNHATITASLWNVMLPAAAVLFVVGVGVQLASAARFGIHPHQNLEIG